MVRPRRKSFFIANERIKRIHDIQNQFSQSTNDAVTQRNTERNGRQTQRNAKSSQKSTDSVATSSQSSNANRSQRQTRERISQRRNTIADSQSTVVTDAPPCTPPPPTRRPAQRRQRLNGIEDRASNENGDVVSSPAKVKQRRDTNAPQSTATVQPESNDPPQQNQRRTRSTSVYSQDDITDSQSIFDASLSTPLPSARPARRQNRLTATDERGTAAHRDEGNQRRTRSKSTNQRNLVDDEPEINNNQRETRSKSAQRRAAAAAAVQQDGPPVGTIQMANDDAPENHGQEDEEEVVQQTNAKNKRQTSRPAKSKATKVQIRRNTIAVNDRELNDVVNFEPQIQAPQMREFSIRLERLSSDIVQRHLAKDRATAVARPQASIACNSQEAKRIINRRYTVNLTRIETADEEDEEEEIDEEMHQLDDMQDDIQPLPPAPQESQPSVSVLAQSSHGPAKSVGPSVDSGLPVTIDPSEIDVDVEDEIEPDSDETYYNSDDHGMSSEISLQDKALSQAVLLTATQVQSAQDGIDTMDIDADSDISDRRVRRPRASIDSQSDEDADEEDGFDENASTYCSELTPQLVNITQMLISQTEQYHSWKYRSYSSSDSINTLEVEFDGPEPNTSNNWSGSRSSTTSKCFIDSPLISYGHFIKCGKETFAVNCLDHNQQNIRHHFLSKYSSDSIHALKHFRGKLWVTEITEHLYLKYSEIQKRQVNVLEYDQPTRVGNATVTAIEAPQFPGGALFLFQGADGKSVLHVGEFRLHAEVTENETLMKNNIDKIQFDQSMLSRVFHCFPLCSDRYVALKAEIGHFIDTNRTVGLRSLIAVGAFEIGMEIFLYELAISFSTKIYMPEEQRNFLDQLIEKSRSGDNSMNFCVELRKLVVDDPKAMIHVLKVDEIADHHLMKYASQFNCHRVLGIRPRGRDDKLGVVSNGAHKIFDVASPLIGDVTEYERFLMIAVEKSMKTPPVPADHDMQLQPCNAPTARNKLQAVLRQ